MTLLDPKIEKSFTACKLKKFHPHPQHKKKISIYFLSTCTWKIIFSNTTWTLLVYNLEFIVMFGHIRWDESFPKSASHVLPFKTFFFFFSFYTSSYDPIENMNLSHPSHISNFHFWVKMCQNIPKWTWNILHPFQHPLTSFINTVFLIIGLVW